MPTNQRQLVLKSLHSLGLRRFRAKLKLQALRRTGSAPELIEGQRAEIRGIEAKIRWEVGRYGSLLRDTDQPPRD